MDLICNVRQSVSLGTSNMILRKNHKKDSPPLRIVRHQPLSRRANRQDTALRRINDGTEIVDAEHSEVRNTECSTLKLLRLELAVSRLRRQGLHRLAYLHHSLVVRLENYRRYEASVRRDGDAHVYVRVSGTTSRVLGIGMQRLDS